MNKHQINIEFMDTKDNEMCSIPDCILCEKLNNVGAILFPKMSLFSKEFDDFGSLFYHRKIESKGVKQS